MSSEKFQPYAPTEATASKPMQKPVYFTPTVDSPDRLKSMSEAKKQVVENVDFGFTDQTDARIMKQESMGTEEKSPERRIMHMNNSSVEEEESMIESEQSESDHGFSLNLKKTKKDMKRGEQLIKLMPIKKKSKDIVEEEQVQPEPPMKPKREIVLAEPVMVKEETKDSFFQDDDFFQQKPRERPQLGSIHEKNDEMN